MKQYTTLFILKFKNPQNGVPSILQATDKNIKNMLHQLKKMGISEDQIAIQSSIISDERLLH